MTTPVREIIPREIEENIKPTLGWFSEILDEVVNFGSNIMAWDMHPKTDGEENLPPTMLFRHFLDIIDSISLLVRQGTGDTPKILARAALEVTFYLEYLFEKNTFDRSMAFLTEDTIRLIKTVKRIHPGYPEGAALKNYIKLCEHIIPIIHIFSDTFSIELIPVPIGGKIDSKDNDNFYLNVKTIRYLTRKLKSRNSGRILLLDYMILFYFSKRSKLNSLLSV